MGSTKKPKVKGVVFLDVSPGNGPRIFVDRDGSGELDDYYRQRYAALGGPFPGRAPVLAQSGDGIHIAVDGLAAIRSLPLDDASEAKLGEIAERIGEHIGLARQAIGIFTNAGSGCLIDRESSEERE